MLHGSFVKCVSLKMPPPEAVSSWHRAQRHLTFCAVHRCFTCFPARLHKAHLLLEAVPSAPKYSGKHCSSSTFPEVAAFANSHTSASLKAFWVSGVLPCSFASCWSKIKVSPRQCPGNGKKKCFVPFSRLMQDIVVAGKGIRKIHSSHVLVVFDWVRNWNLMCTPPTCEIP